MRQAGNGCSHLCAPLAPPTSRGCAGTRNAGLTCAGTARSGGTRRKLGALGEGGALASTPLPAGRLQPPLSAPGIGTCTARIGAVRPEDGGLDCGFTRPPPPLAGTPPGLPTHPAPRALPPPPRATLAPGELDWRPSRHGAVPLGQSCCRCGPSVTGRVLLASALAGAVGQCKRLVSAQWGF